MLHNDFPTVTKIIGVNGANVEHVEAQTHCKVQLRGRGSGFMEPDTNQELAENMFLCLSSEIPENGKAALDMVQDLLKSVLEEHQAWCLTHNLVSPAIPDPLVIENPESVVASGLPAPSLQQPQLPPLQQPPPPQPPAAPGGGDFYGAIGG